MSFLKDCNAFLFDCDGVLWRGSDVFPFAIKLIKLLREKGKKIGFITNNNSCTRIGLQDKLNKRGFDAKLEECFCTAYLAAKYISEKKISKRIYLVGNETMAKELDNFNIKHFGLGPDNYPVDMDINEITVPPVDNVGAVLVGYDKHISLKKITHALTYLLDANVEFIATNNDPVFPLRGNKLSPGTGTIVSAVMTPAQRKPTIVGKPYKPMIDLVLSSLNCDVNEAVMFGDRLDTDILFAVNANMKSVLVYSGVTTKKQYQEYLDNGAFIDGVVCKATTTMESVQEVIDNCYF